MRKAIIIAFAILINVAGWAADSGFSLLGKWQLRTQYCQGIVLRPNPSLDSKDYPEIGGLFQDVDSANIPEITEIEFADNELAVFTTTMGKIKAFYEIIIKTFEPTGSIYFDLPHDSIFTGDSVRLLCVKIDKGIMRYSYIVYQRLQEKSLGVWYISWNILGEMKRQE